MATNNTPNEEVDLGQLFKVIGNGFRNFFNAIGNFFKTIFHFFILLILFFKKQALYLGIATIIGAIFGYFYENSDNKTTYASEMSVIANYGSAKRLYEQASYINNLISEEDSVKIASIFGISYKEANSLSGFSVESIDKDKQFLLDYDEYMQTTDTIFTRDFTFEDFIKRKTKTDLKNQMITATADNPTIFIKLKNGIKLLVENDYYKLIYKNKNDELDLIEIEIKNNLKNIDTLRLRYNKVALLEAKKTNTNNSLNFSTKNIKEKNFDLDLFYMTNSLLTRIEEINIEKIKNKEILKVVSDFEYGEETSSIKNKLWFRYAVYGFILSLLIILGLEFNKYLVNYEQKIA